MILSMITLHSFCLGDLALHFSIKMIHLGSTTLASGSRIFKFPEISMDTQSPGSTAVLIYTMKILWMAQRLKC